MIWLPAFILRPLAGLAAHWQGKLALSAAFALAWEATPDPLPDVFALYGRLFETDPLLILLVVTLLFADWVSGILKAVKEGGLSAIESRQLRRAGWKLVEYSLVTGVCLALANGFENTIFAPVTQVIDEAGLFYIATTEAKSILENVTGSRAQANALWERLTSTTSEDNE